MLKVSVCIPVFNGEKFIYKSIESVLNQTYSNFELIIVDNASTDNTKIIIEKFNDERIKYYRNEENIGGIPNWNKCLDYATGDYIKFLCADDILEKDAIERMINLSKVKNVPLIICAYKVIDINDREIERPCCKKSMYLNKGNDTIKKLVLEYNKIPICPSFFLINKELKNFLENFRLLNNSGYHSDLEYISRAIKKFDGYYTAEIMGSNRRHDMQGTNVDLNNLKPFIEPLMFKETILNDNGIVLNRKEKSILKFTLFRKGLNHLIFIQKKLDKNTIKYLIKNYGIINFLIFPLYILFNYIPRKIFWKLYIKNKNRKRKNK